MSVWHLGLFNSHPVCVPGSDDRQTAQRAGTRVGETLQKAHDRQTEAEPSADRPEEREHHGGPHGLPDQRHALAATAVPSRGRPAAPSHLDQRRSADTEL